MNRKEELRIIIAGVARQLTDRAMDWPPKEVARLAKRLDHYARELSVQGIIYPGDPVQNARGETVGKAMPAADSSTTVTINALDAKSFANFMANPEKSKTVQGVVNARNTSYADANTATEATIAAAIEWGMGQLCSIGRVPEGLRVQNGDPAGTEVFWVGQKMHGKTTGKVSHVYGNDYVDVAFATYSDGIVINKLFSLPRLLAAYAKSKQPPAPAFKAGDRARHNPSGETGEFRKDGETHRVFFQMDREARPFTIGFPDPSDFTPLPPLPAGFKPMATAPKGKAIIVAVEGEPDAKAMSWMSGTADWYYMAAGCRISPEKCLGWQDFPKVEIPKA